MSLLARRRGFMVDTLGLCCSSAHRIRVEKLLASRGVYVLKMYRAASSGGDMPAFWEDNWAGENLGEALRFCEIDPLRPLFERHVPLDCVVLEGGCGLGQYVVYYSDRGRKIVGLDFARGTLAGLRRHRPDIPLCAGDVAQLPFRTGSFDVYFSGGVVEHFEGGPDAALREAWRVLRSGGLLLASVPYSSPLRRAASALGLRAGSWRPMRAAAMDLSRPPDGLRFWQYAFTPREFTRALVEAGFRVIDRQPYALVWGLYELPLVEETVVRLRRWRRRRKGAPQLPLARSDSTAAGVSQPLLPPSLSTRLVVSEDRSVPVLGRLVALLGVLSANMIMFVAIKDD
jgi:SAM-dependent methyltransferase